MLYGFNVDAFGGLVPCLQQVWAAIDVQAGFSPAMWPIMRGMVRILAMSIRYGLQGSPLAGACDTSSSRSTSTSRGARTLRRTCLRWVS